MFLTQLVRNIQGYIKFHHCAVHRVLNVPVRRRLNNDSSENKEIAAYASFEDVTNKTKETYLEMIRIFVNKDSVYRRGHVEFIYAALKNMENFAVHKDIEVYKALVDVMPKGKYIPTNVFQVEFMHYPKQQQCIIDLLEQMEDNGVMPDYEMEDLLSNIFGRKGFPLRKYWRMMYWMPKFKNASPWPLPNPLPDDVLELAKCALQRISSVDVQSRVVQYSTADIEESVDDTWIVSAQSPIQRNLINQHNTQEPLYVEGPFRVWLKNHCVNYFVLKKKTDIPLTEIPEDVDNVSDIKISLFQSQPSMKNVQVNPTIHEQEDGTILGICATGTSSKDSLLSWIRHLERDGNSILAHIPIVFTLYTGPREIATRESDEKTDTLQHV